MTRVNPRLLIALAIAGSGAACADSNNQIYIVQNQALEEDCFVPGGIDNAHRGHGTLDATAAFGIRGGYVLTPVIASRATESANGQEKIVNLTSATIRLLPNNSDASREVIAALADADLDRQEQRFAAAILPGGSTGASFSVVDTSQTEMLSGLVAPGERVEIIARVVVHGDIEGSSVESPEWDYPITVCNGCRIVSMGACADLEDNFEGQFGGVCGFHTDPLYQCCVNPAGQEVCPAKKPPDPAAQ